MSNLARPLDPEFQRIYDEANGTAEPIAHDAEVIDSKHSSAEPEDGFQSFARMAQEHQSEQLSKRPKAPLGSFDHFEQGVSDTISLGWKWLTR